MNPTQMKYFIDTEFLEGTQKTWFGKQTKPTIDLISIGIVAEDGREYYAISKDFNLKEAWNRYQWRNWNSVHNEVLTQKVYWIRENVLLPIYTEHVSGDARNHISFSYMGMKHILKNYGKTNKQIAKEIRNFIMSENYDSGGMVLLGDFYPNDTPKPEFYGYYCDYDWVVFCWLFGKMIDLPKGFPMHCKDLKQELDEKAKSLFERTLEINSNVSFDEALKYLQNKNSFPKQTNEHHALADARWNFELYKFIQNL
jgi:hypothetical protein